MSQNPIATANTRFAATLFGELTRQQPDANVFFSPLSITLALLLAHAGAEGATEQAIEEALGLEGISHQRAAREANTLVQQLAALDQQGAQQASRFGEVEDTVWLRIANALFVNRGMVLKPDYTQNAREAFSAYVEPLDFGLDEAAQTIDQWVSDQTGGKITKIAGQLNRDTVAVLLNAIYFKAPWLHPFGEQATAEDVFTLRNGSTVRVPMMSNSEQYFYQRASDFEVVGLPFSKSQLRMLVLLPSHPSEITALQKQASAPGFFDHVNPRPTQVRLRMPRFKIECDISLNMHLIALGMGIAFNPQQANFSRMVQMNEPVYISEVRHKTFIDLNEKGVEAAAATAIKMMRMSMVEARPVEVHVNRPFIIALQEQQTGALLFLGSVLNPG